MNRHLRLWTLALLTLLAALILPPTLTAQDDEPPPIILAQRPGYHPEGIEWDAAHGRFLTGSITEGGVFTVADDGTVERFIDPVEGLASIGVHIDAARRRVLVAMSDFRVSSDAGAAGIAALGAYDLESGEELFFVDLSGALMPGEGRHFANDVTVDDEGFAYVTDSLSPVIYRANLEGDSEIFLQADAFAAQGFGLNGIDAHPDGYLLVAMPSAAALYKVPLDAPETFSEVDLDAAFSADGMALDENGTLYAVATLVASGEPQVIAVASDDEWATAQIVAGEATDPALSAATLALRDGVPYVVHTHFNELFSGAAVEAFEIIRFDVTPTIAE